MLDLKKIEKEIDNLLASETQESLRNWLNSQNEANVDSYLGEGKYLETLLSEVSCIVDTNTHNMGVIMESCDGIEPGKTQYAMAA